MSSFTSSDSQTFTLTHAKYLASKVAADLKRIQRFYGTLSDTDINNFESEITFFLKEGYMDSVTYGFQIGGNWIEPTVQYTAKALSAAGDDDPGRISTQADISGAQFCSFLVYSNKWIALSDYQKQVFGKNLPFQRDSAPTPGVNGYMSSDRNYSSGGVSLERKSVKKI